MLFAHFLHTFNNLTLRGTQGFLELLARAGYLDAQATPEFAAIGAFIRSSSTSLIINDLMYLFASPFRSRTKLRLGADGTGWSSSKYGDHRKEHRDKKEEAREHIWWRTVFISDVDQLFVVSAWVTNEDIGEGRILKSLLPRLVDRGWDIGSLLLDAGFDDTLLRDDLIEMGIDPFIPYKDGRVNAIPRKHRNNVKHSERLVECFHAFNHYETQFKPVFRFRVKEECCIASVKTRFLSYVRSHGEVGARNEILMMFCCNNLRILNIGLSVLDAIKKAESRAGDGRVRAIGSRSRAFRIAPDNQLSLMDLNLASP
jgi:hypothetical protein